LDISCSQTQSIFTDVWHKLVILLDLKPFQDRYLAMKVNREQTLFANANGKRIPTCEKVS